MSEKEAAETLFFEALDLIDASNFQLAELRLREALKLTPKSSSVLTNLSVVLSHQGKYSDARAFADQVLVSNAGSIEALLVVAHCQVGDNEAAAAVATYDRILMLDPTIAEAQGGRGLALARIGRLADALASCDKALTLRPDLVEAWLGRSHALFDLKRLEEARLAYDKTIELRPDLAGAWNGRGNVLVEINRYEEAIAAYDRALALDSTLAEAWLGRGNADYEMKRYDEALSAYDKALSLRGEFADAWLGRGNACVGLRRYEEAFAAYGRALSLNRDLAAAWLGRGNGLFALRRYDEALVCFDKALTLNPDMAESSLGRGNVFMDLGRDREALASFDKALAIKPDFVEALGNRGLALLKLVRPTEARASVERALAIAPNAICHSNLIFMLNFDPAASAADHQAERARWNALYAQPLSPSMRPHANDRAPDRRLRIGYVSSHFRHQAGTYAFGGVIAYHDPQQVEVVCYSDTVEVDDVTARLRASAGLWRDTIKLSDEALAELIRQDHIDILVDAVGHMSGHRLLVLARKPAPIQITGWGEPTGTGLDAIDYLLADPVLVPQHARALLAERVVELPNFLGYWTPTPLPEPSALPAASRGHVTFGSFNRAAKVQEPVLRSWAAILRALPTARLLIKGYQDLADGYERARIEQILGREGIAADRVMLRDRNSRVGHFADYQAVDIALDPFPHGGGMTTLDALWMGVPVVTFAGPTISSRLAAASLVALGLDDFVATDRESYTALAIAKARDLEALSRLRSTLRARLAGSAIGDPKRYARAVETAYREMWRRWCESTEG